jgi:hypothetical protein
MLRALRAHLSALAKTAADFRDIAGPAWAPRVCAYVCAAHYVEHSLRESHAARLLVADTGAACLGTRGA